MQNYLSLLNSAFRFNFKIVRGVKNLFGLCVIVEIPFVVEIHFKTLALSAQSILCIPRTERHTDRQIDTSNLKHPSI